MSPDSPHDVVELRVGDEHAVRLPGLGTAGYRWTPQPEAGEGVVEVHAAGAAAPASDAVGSSSDELFTIQAIGPGVTVVRFAQRRPWDPSDEPPAGEHLVELHVNGS
jgi:predicted secreted protein